MLKVVPIYCCRKHSCLGLLWKFLILQSKSLDYELLLRLSEPRKQLRSVKMMRIRKTWARLLHRYGITSTAKVFSSRRYIYFIMGLLQLLMLGIEQGPFVESIVKKRFEDGLLKETSKVRKIDEPESTTIASRSDWFWKVKAPVPLWFYIDKQGIFE